MRFKKKQVILFFSIFYQCLYCLIFNWKNHSSIIIVLIPHAISTFFTFTTNSDEVFFHNHYKFFMFIFIHKMTISKTACVVHCNCGSSSSWKSKPNYSLLTVRVDLCINNLRQFLIQSSFRSAFKTKHFIFIDV